MTAASLPLHPEVAPLGFLLGTWRGRGHGDYPTIEPFDYGEQVRFGHAGRPVIAYAQRTWSAATGDALHGESGYVRLKDGVRVELMVAHSFGIVEISEGTLSGTRIEVASTTLASSATAKVVRRTTRTFWLEGDVLRYELGMALPDGDLHRHLTGRLQRAGPG